MLIFLLKLIGIILLCILGILLVLLFLVLLAPVRYYAETEYDKEKFRIAVRASWLFMFRVYVSYIRNHLSYKVRFLFFDIINSEKQKKPEPAYKKNTGEKAGKTDNTDNTDSTEHRDNTNAVENMERTESAERVGDTETTENTGSVGSHGKKIKFHFHFMHPAEIYAIIITKVLDLWDEVCRKIRMAERNLDKICRMVTSPKNQEAILFVLKEIRDIFRHIKPKKHGIYVKAGFKDPALTGQVTGAYSVINTVLSLNFILEPDFDREILEIKAYMKGRIRVLNLLIIAIRLYGNKTLRKLIRRK